MIKMANLTKTTENKTDAVLKLLTPRGLIAKKSGERNDAAKVQQRKKLTVYHNTLSLLKVYQNRLDSGMLS